ncbi:MAG: pyridoxine 5'-phosphate synthase [Campylobacterales bacterium]
MLLGVNIDHIAVLREARRVNDPDILEALGVVRLAGADQITIHLREDRRHIHDEDAKRIVELARLPVNIECAPEPSIIKIIAELSPSRATIVPEKREEVTTEGGLDVERQEGRIKEAIERLHARDVEVSLFIEPSCEAVERSASLGASWVEFHTGGYANLHAMLYGGLANTRYAIPSLQLSRQELKEALKQELKRINEAAARARSLGLRVAAGHGLNYVNVLPIVAITEIEELNIGQSIIARSIFTGLERAVREMKELVRR